MEKGNYISLGVKVSPSGEYFVELFKGKREDGYYNFAVMNRYGKTFYSPLDSDGVFYEDDLLDWSNRCDTLFFSTEHLKKIFIFDVSHSYFSFLELSEGEMAIWDDDGCQWIIRKNAYSLNSKDYYSTEKILAAPNIMQDEPEQKIIIVPNTDYYLWLRKTSTKSYDRKVWKISVFSIVTNRIIINDIGYYAVDNSIRVNNDSYVNFYGINASNDTIFIVNYSPRTIDKAYIWECPPLVPMKMCWVEEDGCWRAMINNQIIRPRPFYFDTMYHEDLQKVNLEFPIALLDLIVAENPEQLEMREKYLQERSAAVKALHEEQNTSMEDLLRRASSGTQFFQRLRIHHLMSHRENPKSEAVIYFIIATILIIVVPVAAIIAAAHGWDMGGVTLKNIATTIILLGLLWITSLTNLFSFRKRSSKKTRIVIILLIIIALLVGVLACVYAQKKEIIDYFEQSVSLCEKATGEADIQKALLYANMAADNGVNGVLFLLAEMYSGNPAPDILDERNIDWYNTLQIIIPYNDTIAFYYYKRCADAAEDSYCADIVAQCLIEGKGVERNIQMAKEYQSKALLFKLQE